MTSLLPGFLTMASLIVAIGAQNAYVLRTGLARRHVGLVVAVCALSDAVLVVAGVLGVGGLVTAHPGLLTVVRWVGAAYLVGYGLLCLRNARHPKGLEADGTQRSRSGVLATVVALTWLNPHVYLDTVLLVGSLANQHGAGGALVVRRRSRRREPRLVHGARLRRAAARAALRATRHVARPRRRHRARHVHHRRHPRPRLRSARRVGFPRCPA